MPRTILCSAGTSIAGSPLKCPSLTVLQKRTAAWEEETCELRAHIEKRLREECDLSTEKGRTEASAELNALNRLPVRPDDEVVLFATDTADGRCCAEAVKDVLENHFGVGRVLIERVPGLQVRDRDLLRRTGLLNLTRKLVAYLGDEQRRYGGGCILNTNGGFKGIVPFFSILGMIFRAPVVYVFEFADCLITLPPLPIGFAADLFERALLALRWAREKKEFSPDEFFRHVPGFHEDERELFASFLEVVDLEEPGRQLACLSPLAEVLAEREEQGAFPILLSREAKVRYQNATGPLRDQLENYFRKLPSPQWRSQHIAWKPTSDLQFHPEKKAQSNWRFAGFMDSGRFHLCWFAPHDEYERLIPAPDKQRAAYPLHEFHPLMLPDAPDHEDIAETHPDFQRDWHDIRSECVGLRALVAEIQVREARTVAELRERVRTVEGQAQRRLSREKETLNAKLAAAEAECIRLREQAVSPTKSAPVEIPAAPPPTSE